MRLQKLSDQVIVITGATSGIGLTTARMAAREGAKVVLTARDEATLRDEVERIRQEGGEATYLAGDVADETMLERVAVHAIQNFGRIDTWVNNAGVGIYALAEEISLADMRRLFDVNFWGVVHGCRAAIPRLRESGGALINVGSIESEIPVPYHSAYSAAKHAVKGYTDTLRLELEKDDANISVTLVKPSAIDTPFFDNAKNYLAKNPQPPPPAYAPEIVARTILHCATKPVRDIVVGGAGRAMIGLSRNFPRTSDRLYEATMFSAQVNDKSQRNRAGSLNDASQYNGRQRGLYDGYVRTHSYTTSLAMLPAPRMLGLALLGVAVVGAATVLRSDAARQGAMRFARNARHRVLSGSASQGSSRLPANVRLSASESSPMRGAPRTDHVYAEYDERSLEMPPRN